MDVAADHCRVYIGTYERGIYGFELNRGSGKLEPLGRLAEVTRPAYLAVTASGQMVYTIMNLADEAERGGIAAFKITAADQRLKLLNVLPLVGKAPCHLNLALDNRYLFAANYQEGTVAAFRLNSVGALDALAAEICHQGGGPNRERQESAHVHYVAMTPDDRHLCAVDLGADQIVFYEVSPEGLKQCPSLSVSIPPGAGPRHLAFHPNRRFVYLITELSSELMVFEYRPEKPWPLIQSISALPDGFTRDNLAAAIQVSPDGRFVYISNRGADSIGVFEVNQASGRLTCTGHTSVLGQWPRDLAIDPSGKYLIVANQNSDTIVVFQRDALSGNLKALGRYPVPSPSCVKYLSMGKESKDNGD